MRTIVSIDIEADGPLPGRNSMRQLGAVAVSVNTGKELASFSRNIRQIKNGVEDPKTMKWWSQFPKAWASLNIGPSPPETVMCQFVDWLIQFRKPVLFAAPTMYDGAWLRWYLERFTPDKRSNLWHRALDMRSVVWARTGQFEGDYRELIAKLTGVKIENPHPHSAVSDAREQVGWLFALLQWQRRALG